MNTETICEIYDGQIEVTHDAMLTAKLLNAFSELVAARRLIEVATGVSDMQSGLVRDIHVAIRTIGEELCVELPR